MEKHKMEALLMACCSHDERSPECFQKPWQRDGYTFATDGKLLIRTQMPVDVVLGIGPNDLSESHWKSLEMPEVDLPELPTLPEVPEITTAECNECNGTREVVCDYGHYHECPECGGTGVKKSGGVIKVASVDLRIAIIDGVYARLLKAINVRPRPRSRKVPVGFVGDGFDGLVMPRLSQEDFSWTHKRLSPLLEIINKPVCAA